jgi:hypothetical protein
VDSPLTEFRLRIQKFANRTRTRHPSADLHLLADRFEAFVH